ncbi:MAG: hypothetical protein V2A73_21095 [Pseudomonadota bacterium]
MISRGPATATRVIAIEVKASAAPRGDAAHHLAWLRDRVLRRMPFGTVMTLSLHLI